MRAPAVVVALVAIALVPGSARADGWELAFEAGAQIDSQPFGVLNATLRKGPWTLRLITDTVEVEVGEPALGGRWWTKVRVQGFASQMLIAPWTDGEPDPSRALLSPHVGAEAGYVYHLPANFYVGAQVFGRGFWFFRGSENDGAVPDPTWWVSPEAVLGFWRGPEARIWAHGGVDLGDGFAAPKIAVEGIWVAPWVVGPYVEAYAGYATNQSFLVKTRLGGLNPYVVPLAGAGWAEFWVERYGVLRVGPNVRWDWGRAALVADLATFDGWQEATFAFVGRGEWARTWFCDVKVGYAPWIPRQGGTSRVSGWLLVGRAFEAL